ncbi:MAG: hypothetical protein RJA25_1522 [Bacteroidota bacterium]|jgi:thiol-disulfide isomerase/thioredoxin
MKYKNLFIVLVIAFIALLLFVLYTGKTPPPSPIAKTTLMEVFPEQLRTGKVEIKLHFKGQVTIVSYFKSWCRDCRRELPELAALQNTVGENNLKVILITDEAADAVAVYIDATKTNFPIYHSVQSLDELGIKRFPTTYLLDKNAEVVAAKVEGIRWNTKKNQALIKSLNR